MFYQKLSMITQHEDLNKHKQISLSAIYKHFTNQTSFDCFTRFLLSADPFVAAYCGNSHQIEQIIANPCHAGSVTKLRLSHNNLFQALFCLSDQESSTSVRTKSERE